MSSSDSKSCSTTFVLIRLKPNDAYSPELFQHVVENTKQDHHTICQWYGMTVEGPHSLYWYIATDTTLAAAPISALKERVLPMTDDEPITFAMIMRRPLPAVLRSPVTISVIMDIADGQSTHFAVDMTNQTAQMQEGMPGFRDWTYGITEDERCVVYIGGWESIEHSLALASFGREEDAKLVEAAEETLSLSSSVQIRHVVFREEASDHSKRLSM